MCIRDSVDFRPGEPGQPDDRQEDVEAVGFLARELQSAGCPADRREPVSYTHLTLPTICSV
eukprot:3280463-Alexandrium_andersonii.AAC.1